MKCKCGNGAVAYIYRISSVDGKKSRMICMNCYVNVKQKEKHDEEQEGGLAKDYSPYSKQIDELRSEVEALKKEVEEIKGYRKENNQSVDGNAKLDGYTKLVSDFYCKHGRFIGTLTDCYDCKNEEKAEKLGKEADKIVEDLLKDAQESHKEHLNVGYGLVFKVANGLYELYGDSLIATDSPYKLPGAVEDAYCGILMGEAHRKYMMMGLDNGKYFELTRIREDEPIYKEIMRDLEKE